MSSNEVWVVEWGNGETDVYADPDEAEQDYAGQDDLLEYATTGGRWVDADEAASWNYGVWSDAAKALVGNPAEVAQK